MLSTFPGRTVAADNSEVPSCAVVILFVVVCCCSRYLSLPERSARVSGYNAEAASFTVALSRVLHTRRIRTTLISTAVPSAVRYYETGAALRADVVNGRMWLGVHFRTSDELGRDLGEHLADWTLDHAFRPTGDS